MVLLLIFDVKFYVDENHSVKDGVLFVEDEYLSKCKSNKR